MCFARWESIDERSKAEKKVGAINILSISDMVIEQQLIERKQEPTVPLRLEDVKQYDYD